MTRQIATGRAGRSYEITADGPSYAPCVLTIDNDRGRYQHFPTMEEAREEARRRDAIHVSEKRGCIGADLPLVWTTVPA